MSEKGLYIQMFSVHGLVRMNNPELGRDADTGGQVLYVVELAKHLAKRDDIRKVDLFTRLISDRNVSEDYARPIETLSDKCRIVRIQCGGKKYMRKELLWPHMDEYIDKTIKFIIRENDFPDVLHGHYPDAGYVAMNLANIFGLPFIYTGHSLGIGKKQKLINDGMEESDVKRIYKIDTRIAAEENILKSADLVIASTNQEKTDQYGSYMNSDFPDYKVIPPGIDVDRFYPFYHDRLPEEEKSEMEKYAQANLLKQLDRFLVFPDKPLILALSRPDKRKNITGLIQAYGEDRELQALANLAIFAGIRKDIDEMEDNEKDVLTRMLLEMDRYDLYGKLAIPKKHDVEYEVPALYRITAEKHGVFVNPAMTEPFGLTLLEAGATGLPLVATDDGGPRDIMEYCQNGILVDTTDTGAIADAIKTLLTDPEYWETCSRNGIMNVRKYYTWDSHADTYIKALKPLTESLNRSKLKKRRPYTPIGKRLTQLKRFLIADIDDIMLCNDKKEMEKLSKWIERNQKKIAFGVTSGRSIEEISEFVKDRKIPFPDIIISASGTEIYYGKEHHYDNGWETHIANRWESEKIKKLLKRFDFLTLQDASNQRKLKISYTMPPAKDRLSKIHDLLSRNKCRYTLVYYDQKHLDIIPYRASKGKAIRYISYKWETPLSSFLICANTGEMLVGEPLGVVVGLDAPNKKDRTGKVIKKGKRIYFAKKKCAGGILEGIEKYRFGENIK
ncbi:MAG: HAD family hydrolase [Desulfosalsimonadaceae bacterium]